MTDIFHRFRPTLRQAAVAAVVAALALAAISFARAPAATLEAIRDAAARRDSAEMARRIDLPALKHSLGRLLLRQMGMALPDNGASDRQLVGQFIVAGALVGPLVNTLVTPEAIIALLQGRVALRNVASAGGADGPQSAAKTHIEWRGLSTVRVWVKTPAGQPLLVLVLRRDGLTWRLAGAEEAATPQSELPTR